jgi:hypothetical protein
MPGTTSLGIPYPFQNETVDAASWQNMATAVDALFTQLNSLSTLATNRPTASISSTGAVTGIASGSTLVQSFATEDWDTGGYANLGVNADRLTLDTGIFYARFNVLVTPTNSATNITLVRTFLVLDGLTLGAVETDQAETDNGSAGQVATSMMAVYNNGAVLQGVYSFFGTGGTAFSGSATLQVYKIRELLDQ